MTDADQAPALSLLAEPLDRSSGLSLGAQLTWRLRRLMGSGALPAGARLPSARELAREVGVNVNTVFSVYGRLEQEGLIDSQHGRGSFVCPGARSRAELIALADETAAAARAAGLDPREVAMSVFVTPEPLAGAATGAAFSPAESAAREERRRLRAEIAALERDLARLEPLAPAAARPGDLAPRLPATEDLRATRDALRTRVAALSPEQQRRYEDARTRRAAAHSSTLEHAAPAAGATQPPAAPLRVRWTPAWGAT
jgi:DNA-binding transcriptional regulator YhcF (GntR family)